MKKSFRGQIAHATENKIRLSTNNGLTGYQIVKFQLAPILLNTEQANTVKIYSAEQGSGYDTVNFDDPTLLASGTFVQDDATNNQPNSMITIFDNTVFNQDIFISCHDRQGGSIGLNYYIEMEQLKLSENEAAVATLKDMRAGPDTNFGP